MKLAARFSAPNGCSEMMVADQPGFTLWLRAAGEGASTQQTAEAIALELGHRGASVELIDAARLARETYASKSSSKGISLAIAMTADALNRHGTVALVHGAKSSAQDFAWKKRKPEKLLDVVCLAENQPVGGTGPYLILRPLTEEMAGVLPDPPSTARVGEEGADNGLSEAALDSPVDDNGIRYDTVPLFDALEKAGLVATGSTPGNGADELLRKRLKDLGYL
jgi:hypothetical protein